MKALGEYTHTHTHTSNLKNKKGITLVALVITVVILLILAGITISAIGGEEGIFNTAKKSTDKSTEATAIEEIKLIVYEVQTENQGTATLQQIVKKLEEDKKNIYIVTTKTETASLTTQDGIGITDVNQITDKTEAIYITNTKYWYEVKVSSTLKVSSTAEIEKEEKEDKVITLSEITEENYGDYIDIGNDIVLSSATTDDWRIFLKDDNYVYAILASYLPTSIIPEETTTSAGLVNHSDGYNVKLSYGPTAVNAMINEEYWDFLVPENLKDIAIANGAATSAQLTTSWNTNPKNISSKRPTNSYAFNLDVTGLYVFGQGKSATQVDGFWVATLGTSNSGTTVYEIVEGKGLQQKNPANAGTGLRPIIKLPLNLQVKEGRVWTLVN